MTANRFPSLVQQPSRLRVLFSLMIIFACGLFIYGWHLGNSPLDRTEPFRALVAHQMAISGDWLIPRLYGEVYLRKPPLIYWIEASAEKLMGHGNEFVWRLPSAVGSAALAAIMAWFASRWFGDKALIPGGVACLALIALWDQDRSTDIDALNTLAAMITTICVLELICGLGHAPVGWSLAVGLSLAAALLLKGPGALPQVAGAIIGPAIFLSSWRLVRRPSLIIGLLIGFAIFAVYLIAAMHAMHVAGIRPDQSGGQELIDKIFLHGWTRRRSALIVPVKLLAFALPISMVLPFTFVLIRKASPDDRQRQRAVAILGTLAASLVIWFIANNDNPRYEYVMLPLLAPLVGYVWANWDLTERWFRTVLLAVCILFFGANFIITLRLPHGNSEQLVAAIVSGLIALMLIAKRIRNGAGLFAVAIALLLLLAFPMAGRKNAERQKKSAKNVASQLRAIMGGATHIADAGVTRDMPELFYYSGLSVDAYGENGLATLAAKCRGQWVILSENPQLPAYSTLLKFIPNAFPNGLTKLQMPDPRDRLYVGFYNPPAGASTYLKMNVRPAEDSDE